LLFGSSQLSNNFPKRAINVAVLSFIVALFFSANLLSAQTNNSNQLKEIADLFIGKWRGVGTSPNGTEFISELKFEWTLDKHFLKVENTLREKNKTTLFALTIYGRQPVLNKIVFWSFDKDGTINEGLAQLNGQTLHHEWRSFGSNGEIKEWRSKLTRQSKEELNFTIYEGSETNSYTLKYERVH